MTKNRHLDDPTACADVKKGLKNERYEKIGFLVPAERYITNDDDKSLNFKVDWSILHARIFEEFSSRRRHFFQGNYRKFLGGGAGSSAANLGWRKQV